jgi:hypothetical protein
VPDPKISPAKELTAIYAYLLWDEFAPRRNAKATKASLILGGPDALAALDWWRWQRLSPKVRAQHRERLQRIHDQPKNRYRHPIWQQGKWRVFEIPRPTKLGRMRPPVPGPKSMPYIRPRRVPSQTYAPSRSKLPELAMYLFAFFTGIADENMQWPCRRVLSQMRPRRSPR